MDKRKDFVFKILILTNILCLFANFYLMSYSLEKYNVVTPFSNVVVRGVSASHSMHPTINKGIYPLISTRNRVLESNDTLYLGRIYIYRKNESSLIVHRLVGVYNTSDFDQELIYVFMGDNNEIVDKPIKRDQIIEEVLGVNFE